MATRFVERSPELPNKNDYAGNVAGIHVDSDDSRLKFYDRTADMVRTVEDGRLKVLTPAAAVELTAEQTGSTIFLNAAAGFDITLPLPAAGLRYKFITAAAFATSNFVVKTNGAANIIEGGVIVNSAFVPGVGEDAINFVATAETIGDWVEVVSDGTTWFVTGIAASAGAVTLTT